MTWIWLIKAAVLMAVVEIAIRLISAHVAPARRGWVLVAVVTVAAAVLAWL